MVEAVAARGLAGSRARPGGGAASSASASARRFVEQLGQGLLGNRSPSTTASCRARFSRVGESVDARGDRRLHGVGERRRGRRPPRSPTAWAISSAKNGFPALVVGDPPAQRRVPAVDELRRELLGGGGRQRAAASSRWWPSPVAEARATAGDLGTRGADHEQRASRAAVALASSSSRKPSSAQCTSSTAITTGRSIASAASRRRQARAQRRRVRPPRRRPRREGRRQRLGGRRRRAVAPSCASRAARASRTCLGVRRRGRARGRARRISASAQKAIPSP